MEEQKPRQIIIETDGNAIKVIKNETTGGLEFWAILQILLNSFKK